MKSFPVVFYCFCGMLFPGIGGLAQPVERQVSVDVAFFSSFRPHPPALFFQKGEHFEPVVFPRNMQGDTVRYEGPEMMIFFTETKDENGQSVYLPAAQVLLAAGLRQPLLVFSVVESSEQESEIRILPMEIDAESFPKGNLSVINLTGITMQAMIGERRAEIPPGLGGPYAFAESGVFRIGLAFEFDGRVYPSFLNTVTLDPQTRQWMFIGSPRRAGSARVRVRFMEDHTLLRQEVGG